MAVARAGSSPRPPDQDAPSELDLQLAEALPEHFIGRFVMIRPAGGGEAIPFELWDLQREVLVEIQTRPRIIVLKARQLGLSWLALAYALWLCLFSRGQTVLILNRGQREASAMLRRVKYMYERLPDELQKPFSVDRFDEIGIAGTDSQIISLPTTEDTGSSYTFTFVIADELAKIANAATLMTAVLPTLSAGGTLVGISTAKGYHNYFAEHWRGALSDANDSYPIFIPSSSHPDRDDAWHEAKRREFPSDRAFRQEYPERWQEAFQLAGDVVFDEFDRGRHHRPGPRAQDSQWTVWRALDFGFHHAPVLWLEVQASRYVWVFAELHGQGLTTDELALAIRARDQELGLTTESVPAGVDPAGKSVTAASSDTEVQILQRHGIRCVDANVLPKDRVNQITGLLRQDRLFVDVDACPYLSSALEQAQWKTRRAPDGQMVREETQAKDGMWEHPIDALGYALINIFPVHGVPTGAIRTSSPRRSARYSSSEFG